MTHLLVSVFGAGYSESLRPREIFSHSSARQANDFLKR
jgi:hypothetical protein